MKTIEDIQRQLAEWKEEQLAGFDANTYYNDHRVNQYTDWNRVPQHRLTSLAYALSGLDDGPALPLILDIGAPHMHA
jgi:hypothetical protein